MLIGGVSLVAPNIKSGGPCVADCGCPVSNDRSPVVEGGVPNGLGHPPDDWSGVGSRRQFVLRAEPFALSGHE